jgi:hypothetical protein
MSNPVDLAHARPCAYCRARPAVAAHRPFCSAGCQARDLNAWLSDRYVLPADPQAPELFTPDALDNDPEAG